MESNSEMHYLRPSEIRSVHLELSSHCNAACPQCDRNIFGGHLNPRLSPKHLTLADMERIFPQEFCAHLDYLIFSGVHGDPMMAPDVKKILGYFCGKLLGAMEVQTNGSIYDPSWWQNLGSMFKGTDNKIVFAIDGLEDTHSLYRKGTDWKKVTNNMRAFIEGGGKAQWNFLIFKHNEHQVEHAKLLANEWGCAGFQVRRTHRFHALGVRNQAAPCPVLKKQNHRPADFQFIQEIDERIGSQYSATTPFSQLLADHGYEYKIEETSREEYINSAAKNLPDIAHQFEDIDVYFNQTKISCKERAGKRIYLDADQRVWPCCYIGGDTKSWHYKHRFREDLYEKLAEKYGVEFNSLKHSSLESVLDHPWFKHDLVESWGQSIDDPANPRLKRCARTCGELYRPNASE